MPVLPFTSNVSLLFLGLLLFYCCSPSTTKRNASSDLRVQVATGDSLALALAEKVEAASGGIAQWNKIPYIRFDYFGSRFWYWDKWENRYRVESEKRKFRIAGTLDGQETHLWLNGAVVTESDSINKYKDLAYRSWINDTYWLILPFKLNDPGVHLHYLGNCSADSLQENRCMELTFDTVGVTPDNKYILYIDTITNHIVHWDYFRSRTDSLPSISNPWSDYRAYGPILLSVGRGDRSFSDILIFESLPQQIFKDVSLSASEIMSAQDALIYTLIK